MNEISKNLNCVLVRGGIEIWLGGEQVSNLKRVLDMVNGNHKFIDVGGELINTQNIVGIISAKGMEEATRRKNGQWKCSSSRWHDRGEKCFCAEHGKYKDFTTNK